MTQNENRGVDENALRQMKQRQSDLQRHEEQQTNNVRQNSGGLRVSFIDISLVFFAFSSFSSSGKSVNSISPIYNFRLFFSLCDLKISRLEIYFVFSSFRSCNLTLTR